MRLKRLDGNVANLLANICSCKQFPRNVTKTHKHVSFCCLQKSSRSDFLNSFCQRGGGRRAADSAARYKPSPPSHTPQSR